MRWHKTLAASLLVGLTVIVLGCGGPVRVEGKVTRKGKPLAGATVVFIPEAGGPEAGDVTDEEGKFRLKGTKQAGVLPGAYRVTVSKKVYPPGVTPPTPDKMSIRMVETMKETVSSRYTMQDQTPLRVTVPRGGKSDVLLEVE
jgi:hypothetical protein